MAGFFDRMWGRKQNSANKAKERLQVVLIHDRINLSPEHLQAMKEELLAVISKYVAVSGNEIEIALEQRDRQENRLIAEIPFAKPQEQDPLDDAHAQETQPSRPPDYDWVENHQHDAEAMHGPDVDDADPDDDEPTG